MTLTPDTPLDPPRTLPPSCSSLLLDTPLADLADALAARLGMTLVDIDPRDRLHLRRLKGVIERRVEPAKMSVSDAILPPTSGTTPKE